MDQEIDNYVNQKHDSKSTCIIFAKFVVFRNFTHADHRSTGQPTAVGGMKECDAAVQYPKYRNRGSGGTAKLCLRFVPGNPAAGAAEQAEPRCSYRFLRPHTVIPT
jgi:hypothetical protein